MTATEGTRKRPNWRMGVALAPGALNFDFLAGLAIVALVPAVCWPLLMMLAGLLLGFAVSWLTMAMVGAGIFCFLAVIYAAVARKR